MPVVSRSRTINALPERIWTAVADPEQLPGWWPGVERVEDAYRDAWTAVLTSKKGRALRADYTLLESDHPRRRSWRHEVAESPFERILADSVWDLELEPEAARGTHVTLTARLTLRGFSRFGGLQVRLATRKQLEAALGGLERLAATW
jgi:uncharacterized protein YndB with AHSA1/START domain